MRACVSSHSLFTVDVIMKSTSGIDIPYSGFSGLQAFTGIRALWTWVCDLLAYVQVVDLFVDVFR